MLLGLATVTITLARVLSMDPSLAGRVPWNQPGRARIPSFDVRKTSAPPFAKALRLSRFPGVKGEGAERDAPDPSTAWLLLMCVAMSEGKYFSDADR